jgi:hemerythrin-like domain-containing protein
MPEDYLPRDHSRRNFLSRSAQVIAGAGLLMTGMQACKSGDEDDEKEVSPPEDLMQEHGLLNRILLIYDHCHSQLVQRQSFDPSALFASAQIVRTFVEDYHEKQEEDYLFPRFRKANQLNDLVAVLQQQHDAGRSITSQLMQLTKPGNLGENESGKVVALLQSFNTMYRPHESREDTVLFPAFRKIVSRHEYDSLGEEFESNEQKKFGKDGFETMVAKVAAIEKQLGIYELGQFTPRT